MNIQAVKNQQPWANLLKWSRERPGVFLGDPGGYALQHSIKAPIRLVMETEAFVKATQAELTISPNEYKWRFESGPIRPEIDAIIQWRENDVLFEAISSCWTGVRVLAKKWTIPFQSNINLFDSIVVNLLYAGQGMLAIRNHEGIWWQRYQEGWPVTPPMLNKNLESPTGLMIACSLSNTWFKELPFDLAVVKAIIPDELKSRVQITWHDKDTIFKKSAIIDRSPKAFERWLR